MSGKTVKLRVYEHQADEVVVSDYSARQWSDFLLVSVESTSIEDLNPALLATFSDYGKKANKMVIILHPGVDISFYGVEVDEEVGSSMPRSLPQ